MSKLLFKQNILFTLSFHYVFCSVLVMTANLYKLLRLIAHLGLFLLSVYCVLFIIVTGQESCCTLVLCLKLYIKMLSNLSTVCVRVSQLYVTTCTVE